MLSTAGSWSRNYPFFKKSRVSSRSSALKAACCEVIRLTVCQFLTSLQALLVLLGSIAWILSETQKACFCKEVPWSLAIPVFHRSFTGVRAGAFLTILPTAQDGCRLLKSTEATSMVDPYQGKLSSRDARASNFTHGREPLKRG